MWKTVLQRCYFILRENSGIGTGKWMTLRLENCSFGLAVFLGQRLSLSLPSCPCTFWCRPPWLWECSPAPPSELHSHHAECPACMHTQHSNTNKSKQQHNHNFSQKSRTVKICQLHFYILTFANWLNLFARTIILAASTTGFMPLLAFCHYLFLWLTKFLYLSVYISRRWWYL